MIICIESPWDDKPGTREQHGDVTLVFNQYHPDATMAVDVKWAKSELSSRFPPEARVWVHLEPAPLTDYFTDFEKYYAGGILSWHQALKVLPQFRQYRQGGKGMGVNHDLSHKTFGVGGLFSGKNTPGMDGYALRRLILEHQRRIRIPSLVHNFRKAWLGVPHRYPRADAEEALRYMFHFAVENCRETRYFTEKLMRCFASMCVPLYYGDPEISEEFDPDGIILIDQGNWLDVVNHLTPRDYFDRLEPMRRNYFRSMRYWGKTDRIAHTLTTLPTVEQSQRDSVLTSECLLRPRSNAELVSAPAGNYRLVDKESNREINMNEAAALVWSLADGTRSAKLIADEICRQFLDVGGEQIRFDIADTVSRLVELKLLEFDHAGLDWPGLVAVPVEGNELREADDGYLLMNGEGSLRLNPPSALVAGLCDGRSTTSELVWRVGQGVCANGEEFESDVIRTVFVLADKGFLDIQRRQRGVTVGRIDSATEVRSKPRVLLLLTRYPQLSETYIKNEIETLKGAYELKVVAFEDSNLRFSNHFPYTVATVRGDTMTDQIEDVDGRLAALIEEFDPDIIHTHYLNNARLVGRLSERSGVPFTLRAHSYDVVAGSWRPEGASGKFWPTQVARNAADAINQENCLGMLTFPYTVDALQAAGIKSGKIHACYPVVDFARFYDRGPNGQGLLNVEPCLPKKAVTDFIDLAVLAPAHRFSLYGMGHQIDMVRRYNEDHQCPVDIFDPVEPEQMPAVYKAHDWLIYTSNFENGNLGWPLAVFEAQASGLGICIANVHAATADQLGGAGFVYNSVTEIPAIVSRPYPADMRERGFDNARRADVRRHISVLTDLWDTALAGRRSTPMARRA